MAEPLDFTDLKCPKCGYELTGLTSGVCPECGITITPALFDRDQRRAKRNRRLRTLLIIAFIMYAPHSWLVFMDYPWTDYRWQWLWMWPILPGLPATILTRLVVRGHLPEGVEFACMAILTISEMLLLTWIASRSRRALVAVIILLIPPSLWMGFATYSIFRM